MMSCHAARGFPALITSSRSTQGGGFSGGHSRGILGGRRGFDFPAPLGVQKRQGLSEQGMSRLRHSDARYHPFEFGGLLLPSAMTSWRQR